MRRLAAIVVCAFGLLVAWPLIAQDQMSPEEQRDWFVQFVEGQLSTPDRQIRISNIDGVLSDSASIREITISDKDGVWLRVENASINWDQAALFTGRLFVRTLAADSIAYLRAPVESGDPDLPPPEAAEFQVPEFPVAILIEELELPQVAFDTSLFGLGSEISVAGNLRLENGSLDTNLDITRLDGPGGNLVVDIAYQGPDNSLDVGVTLTEPPNGILVNLLNIEGRPEIALSVKGAGPIADLRMVMAFEAGGKRALTGLATITQKPEGFAVAADLRGPVADLVAPAYRPFFGSETTLSADALVRASGGLSLSGITLSGGQLALTAEAETTGDGFVSKLDMQARIADPAGGKVILPIAGAQTSVNEAVLDIDFGATGTDNWTSSLAVRGFANAALSARALSLEASGVASNLDNPQLRRVTFNGDGTLSGIAVSNPDAQDALGDTIGLGIAGLIEADKPLQLAQLRLAGKALEVLLSGTVDDAVFDGAVSITTASITPFSGIAGRDLAGALSLSAKGSVSPLTGGFDLNLDGNGENLSIDEAALDPVLRGQVRLTGRLARTEQGIEADDFRITNPQIVIAADGRYATGVADFRFGLDLADLALVADDASGALSVVGTAKGDQDIALNLTAKVPSGTLAGRRLTEGEFGFAGTLNESNILSGVLDGSAFLDGFAVSLAADIAADTEHKRLDNLRFAAGPTTLTGGVTQDNDGVFTGKLSLASPNVSIAAALLTLSASGAASADIDLGVEDGKQSATIVGTVRDLDVEGSTTIGTADIRGSIADLFGVPQIDGTITGKSITVGDISIATLDARANRSGETTRFAADASLSTGTLVSASGGLTPLPGGYELELDQATLTQGQLTAALAQPVSMRISGETVALDAVRIDVGSGRITATGTAGAVLNVEVDIDALPLSVANAIQPELGLRGTLNGSARITGSASAPQAQFRLTGNGIGAAQIASFGIDPLSFSAAGSFADNTVQLTSLTGEGAGGLRYAASGKAPLAGRGLALKIEGSAPLALGSSFVADRGGQLSGTVTFDVGISGSLDDPMVAGTAAVSGGGYVDPELNLRFVDINGSARLSADQVVVERVTANVATGGSVSASGTIDLGPGMPADLAVQLNSARYADGTLFVATVSGAVRLTGRLAASPLLSGRVFIEKADISVPENLGGSAALIEVDHVNAPVPVQRTLTRAKVEESGAPVPQSRPSVLQLDVAVEAPNQIYIRGRGLDAEVGGSVRLTGPVNDIRPVGAFSLNRGRLSILGQRITFTRGEVTLVGDLDPLLNLVAETQEGDLTVYVTVSGRVSDVQVDFTASPALPQDEVLSRLLFKRSMGELSPLQLARLAGAAAELAGGGGNSLVDSLRDRAGLDNLDVTTDEDGNLAVQAGAYVQENIYLGVQAGADGNSRVTVNLDITDDIKARASTAGNGESSVGVFFETDY